MSNALIALGIVALVVGGTIAFALASVKRLASDPREYVVAGRSFGAFFLWLLLAGEVYTAFTFLGAAGWAYSFGAAAFYILAYGTIGFVIGYFLLPALNAVGHARGLLTSADFFRDRFGSRALGIAVGALQFVLLVPYVTLQLTGLQILLTIAGYNAYNATAGVAIAFLLMALFVFTAGLRGMAWASIVKDGLVLLAVIFAGIVIPAHFFGSVGAMFDRLVQLHPQMLTFPTTLTNHSLIWYLSTVVLTGVGFFTGPHTMNAIFSARDGNALRRNSIWLPIYQLVLLLVFFAGFAALLIVPGMKPGESDQSFVLVVQRFYPAWVTGVIAAAGVLAALVPAAALLLGGASTFAKNVLADGFGVAKGDREQTMAMRISVIALAVLALLLWLVYKKTLVDLLLYYYNGVTQFMPGLVFAFVWKQVSATAIGLGIAGGLATVLVTVLEHVNPTPWGINIGLLALVVNIIIVLTVTTLYPRRDRAPEIAQSQPSSPPV